MLHSVSIKTTTMNIAIAITVSNHFAQAASRGSEEVGAILVLLEINTNDFPSSTSNHQTNGTISLRLHVQAQTGPN